MMLLKCCTQYISKFGKLSSGHKTEKVQISFQSQRKKMPKNVQTTIQLCSFHMLARCNAQNPSSCASAIHEPRAYRCTTWFRKGRGTRNQIANIHWVIEKAKEFQKISTSASSTTLKPLTVWITKICGKFLKRWQYQPTLHVF